MYDTLIVHGSFGSPYENWFPWLSKELTAAGRSVLVPQFPAGEMQSLSTWSKVLDAYREHLSKNLVVFAHSLGPAFLANYLPDRNIRVGRAFLVVPFYSMIGISDFDIVNSTFMKSPGGPAAIRSHCSDITCVFSDNDPYVPRSLCEDFAKQAGGAQVVVPGGGHLNAEAGFREFPLLLQLLGESGQVVR